MEKRALGRGLEALLTPTSVESASSQGALPGEQVLQIPILQIKTNKLTMVMVVRHPSLIKSLITKRKTSPSFVIVVELNFSIPELKDTVCIFCNPQVMGGNDKGETHLLIKFVHEGGDLPSSH